LIKKSHGRGLRPSRRTTTRTSFRKVFVAINSHDLTPADAGVAASGNDVRVNKTDPRPRWEARHDLDWYRAETERLRVLIDFLARPICAHGGADPDPDIVTAYNLAVEAALKSVRRGAAGRNPLVRA
jgi:hypothetical protein